MKALRLKDIPQVKADQFDNTSMLVLRPGTSAESWT